MTPGDLKYLELIIGKQLLINPVLEIGSREVLDQGGNCRATVTAAGFAWEGADIQEGPGVDWIIDLLDDDAIRLIVKRWGTILLFNVLEHVYDPAAALRNACSLLDDGGRVVVITPTVWQLHDFPADYWRPLPDFYFEFAERHHMRVLAGSSYWILDGTQIPLTELGTESQKLLPARFPLGERVFGRKRLQYSRLVHRVFSTIGRKVVFPYSALGLVLEDPNSPRDTTWASVPSR
jgi:SAM-dependent methyltransferase